MRKLIAALPPSLEAERLLARHRLGAILKDRLGDARGAEEQLVEVLAAPGGEGNVPSMLTLAAIYRERRDWLKARQLLGRAAAAVQDVDERVRLLVEAAEICANQLDDENQASEIYADALALDPARLDLVDKLATIRFRRGDWTSLLPLAERLVADLTPVLGVPEKPPEEKARLWYQLARAAEEKGELARAAEAYGASLAALPEGPQTLAPQRDLAALTFRLEQWPEAAAAHEALLAGHGGALKRPETLAALERLGIAYMQAGEPAKAIAPLEKALTLEPRRRVVLEALVEAAKAAGDDDAVVRHTQALLSVTEDRKTKLELLEHVATIHHERRKDPQRAIAAYRAALDIWPDERSIMHRLLELLTETKQWKQSVVLLLKLARADRGRSIARRITSPPATSCPTSWARSARRSTSTNARSTPTRATSRRSNASTRWSPPRATGRRRSGRTAGRSSAWGRTWRPTSAPCCSRSGTGWARSTARGSRTIRRRSPRSRWRPTSIPRRPTGAGSWRSSIA